MATPRHAVWGQHHHGHLVARFESELGEVAAARRIFHQGIASSDAEIAADDLDRVRAADPVAEHDCPRRVS